MTPKNACLNSVTKHAINAGLDKRVSLNIIARTYDVYSHLESCLSYIGADFKSIVYDYIFPIANSL